MTQDFDRLVESWLEDTASPIPDPVHIYPAVAAGIAGRPQQRRSWLRPFEFGRSRSMFSATKFVVAGVIVALFGSFLLAGVLTQPSGDVAPAAETTSGPGTFHPAGSLAQPRRGQTATRLKDGRVLIVGGFVDGYREDDTMAEVWHPVTGSFSPAGFLLHARAGHTATLLPDGRVFIVGGCCDPDAEAVDDHTVLEAEVWDPSTASFGPAGTLGEGREELHTATLLPDGRVLILGGLRIYGVSIAETAEVWDPATTSFGLPIALDPTRAGHTATLLDDGRVLIAGGHGGDPRTEREVEAPALIWDSQTATFEPADAVVEGRAEHTATRLPDGRVLLVGGYALLGTAPQYGTYPPAEIWDPITASVQPAGAPAEGRVGHTTTLLPDGRVLLVGGRPGDLASAELWDPATALFEPAATLTEGRADHTATLLQDGRVLIVGGTAGEDTLASAELWEPGDGLLETDGDDTAPTPDLLPGVDLVTEEVEPGVYRVLSDGVRDPGIGTQRIIAGRDDGLWLVGLAEDGSSFFRLGSEAHTNSAGSSFIEPEFGDIEIGPDGVVWWAHAEGRDSALESFHGQGWTVRNSGRVDQVELLADGTVLASWTGGDEEGRKLARLGPDGWDVLGRVPLTSRATLAADDVNEIWLLLMEASGIQSLYRGAYPPGAEGDIGLVGLPKGRSLETMDPGPDGTLWAVLERADGERRVLARFDGSSWVEYDRSDALPVIAGSVHAGPDGSAWFVACTQEGQASSSCALVRFDGRASEIFLRSQGLDRLDIAGVAVGPAEAAWLLLWGGEDDETALYVITPEAVAATE